MIRELTSVELSQRIRNGERMALIDVRTSVEFSRARIPDTVNIPLDLLPQADLSAAGGLPIVFVCQVGARSYNACQIAMALGFNDVYNLSDGTKGWIEAGLPYE